MPGQRDEEHRLDRLFKKSAQPDTHQQPQPRSQTQHRPQTQQRERQPFSGPGPEQDAYAQEVRRFRDYHARQVRQREEQHLTGAAAPTHLPPETLERSHTASPGDGILKADPAPSTAAAETKGETPPGPSATFWRLYAAVLTFLLLGCIGTLIMMFSQSPPGTAGLALTGGFGFSFLPLIPALIGILFHRRRAFIWLGASWALVVLQMLGMRG